MTFLQVYDLSPNQSVGTENGAGWVGLIQTAWE